MTNDHAQPPETRQSKSVITGSYQHEEPCEKYRQFMDSSRQERTFMIEKLVETFANVIDSIWHPKFLVEHQKVKVMPTKGFCSEILRRSKATYSTVQISLFYVFRVKRVVHEKLYQRIKQDSPNTMNTKMDDLMCCGRRMFLASLMVASKYLHDKNYHNKAWAKITGLDIQEINAAEMAFLQLIDYRLHINKTTFDKWYTQLHGHIQKGCPSGYATPVSPMTHSVTHSISATPVTNAALIRKNYPSPPPDENNQPLSPIVLSSDNQCMPYQRTDSGVSFDLLSPPLTTTTKRQFIADEERSVKRLCQ
ncbi:cyclin-domain-containing protein [Choanephora cucurbitarum]|nr:cyclin-domain-containing protein [Choanephora cucurbitarum]